MAHVSGRAQTRVRTIQLRNKSGQVIGVAEGVWTGIPGLWVTPIPEHAGEKYRISMGSGFALGGVFDSVKEAVAAIHTHADGAALLIPWTREPAELASNKAAFMFFLTFRAAYA